MRKEVPCLYLLDMQSYYLDGNELKHSLKLGSTLYPSCRKLDYITSHPTPPKYIALFYLDPKDFPNKNLLYTLDSVKFKKYVKKGIAINRGEGNEWYCDTGELVQIVAEFLEREGYKFKLVTNDPYTNTRFILTNEKQILLQEDVNKMCSNVEDYDEYHKSEFLRLIVPGGTFRSIQDELWNIFLKMIRTNNYPIKGIIQWPTGVGKTVAILLIIILAKKYKLIHEHIHALVVAPKNDIFQTVLSQFKLLENYGINILIGLSKIKNYPHGDWLLLATHNGLVGKRGDKRKFELLPQINFFLYDEVHRVTGPHMFDIFKRKTLEWNTPFVLGTSATPLTSHVSQHLKIKEIYGDKLIQKCDYATAIKENWIVKPLFNLYVHSGTFDNLYRYMGNELITTIEKRKNLNMWQGGKVICYVPQKIEESEKALNIVSDILPSDYVLYSANSSNQ